MELVQLIEDRNVIMNSGSTSRGGSKIRQQDYKRKHRLIHPVEIAPGVKRLTETEITHKKAKGLCFYCDEKFKPVHRYKDRTLQVLTVYDDEDDRGEGKEGAWITKDL